MSFFIFIFFSTCYTGGVPPVFPFFDNVFAIDKEHNNSIISLLTFKQSTICSGHFKECQYTNY